MDVLLSMAAAQDGFSTTAGVLFRVDPPDTGLVPIDVHASMAPDAAASLVVIGGPHLGERVPVDLLYDTDGGPFGAPGMVTLLPLQGVPLRPGTPYAAVVRRSAGADGPLGVSPALWTLASGGRPDGLSNDTFAAYHGAIAAFVTLGEDPRTFARLAVFTTGDPTEAFRKTTAAAREASVPFVENRLIVSEVYEDFCVLQGTVEMPNYPQGTPPFTADGGWSLDEDGVAAQAGTATSRLWVTVPRVSAPVGGYPVTVMVRAGGGGDRPLIDRGTREAPGSAAVPGTGPAAVLAAAGQVGVQVDGPHGGPFRNPGGADEQFLMFNVNNPVATRDNVRQSALEIAVLPGVLATLSLDASACPGAAADVPLDLDRLGLMGHSMGATIAPLVLTVAPEYDRLVLSGAGGSYLYNLVYKESPIADVMRPLAPLLPYGGSQMVTLPVTASPVRAVVQVAEDGIENGHEVWFQVDSAKQQTRCFLSEGVIPVPGALSDPCP